MNGNFWPLGWLRFLLEKQKIDTLRAFLIFVIPEFQSKGVSAVLCWDSLKAARRLGYRWVDASTTSEFNHRMHLEAASFGGDLFKTYRIYSKDL
jgi:GNAT superfamily N-acetyltransferase